MVGCSCPRLHFVLTILFTNTSSDILNFIIYSYKTSTTNHLIRDNYVY